jgi:hypothetical protein
VNSGAGRVKIELLDASSYTPGTQHRLRITVEDPSASRWGFELSARITGQTQKAGDLAVADGTITRSDTAGGYQYITQNGAGTRAGTPASASWEVFWTAPSAGTGNVTFYAAGNAANRNFSTSGDNIYTTSLTVSEGGGATVPTKSYTLPQFVFGGGWYTALYFSNSSDQARTVNLKFYGDNGSPLSVPLPAGGTASEQNLNLPGRGTVIFETLSSGGSLVSGWVDVALPEGVSGYGIFRQSSPPTPDQEAVVPLTDDSKQTASFTFDDTNPLVTAVAVSNPKEVAATVTITVRDSAGAVIGTRSLSLPARAKTAFTLRSDTLGAVAGKRGSATFTTTTGAVSVLGLRFKDAAFSSIPAEHN